MAELIFDSRVNYQKVYIDSSVQLSVANPEFKTSTTIAHNLGYIPSVRIWFTNASGKISTPITDAAYTNLYPVTTDYNNKSAYFTVDSTNLVITFDRGVTVGTTQTTTVYYRIYLDGA